MNAENQLQAVLDAIEKACNTAQRPVSGVQLTAVSKTFSPDQVRPVLAAGHRVFGENRVQEAAGKWPALRQEFADVELHLIGPLQSNKAAQAVELFDVIHTVDRPKIARALRAEMDRQNRGLSCYIQVNIGAEPQKAGVAIESLPELLTLCQSIDLKIDGLMCIPPQGQPAGPHFALLSKLAKTHGLSGLSMGMSADFESAIMQGATAIRVGSAVFGARPTPASAS